MAKKRLRGYGFSHALDGKFTPQRIQNLIIRNYSESNDFDLIVTAFEFGLDDCYMVLEELIEKIDTMDGILFYSINFLPKDKEKRQRIFNILLKKEKELHFALENLSIINQQDADDIEEVMAFRDLTSNNLQIS